VDEHQRFLAAAREDYKSFGSVWVPAFAEVVIFSGLGFNHLLRKERKFRSRAEQVRRLKLVGEAIEILGCAEVWHEFRERMSDQGSIKFWTFLGGDAHAASKVVVVQYAAGLKQFLSIM
jgi:hypothetical protein